MRENMDQTADSEYSLTGKERQILLGIAKEAVTYAAKHGKRGTVPVDPAILTPSLETECGAFVTLHKKGRLRGCIGHLTGDMPLWKMVREMAFASSLSDYRFSQVTEEELPDIKIEISVLSPLKKIGSPGEITLGKHGIYIVKGGRSGVFLPQVATETGWSREEFLGHCARDKAGIGWDGWRGADIYIFTAEIFG